MENLLFIESATHITSTVLVCLLYFMVGYRIYYSQGMISRRRRAQIRILEAQYDMNYANLLIKDITDVGIACNEEEVRKNLQIHVFRAKQDRTQTLIAQSIVSTFWILFVPWFIWDFMKHLLGGKK